MQPWMYGKAGPPRFWDVPFPVDPLSDSYESKSLMGGHLISDPIITKLLRSCYGDLRAGPRYGVSTCETTVAVYKPINAGKEKKTAKKKTLKS